MKWLLRRNITFHIKLFYRTQSVFLFNHSFYYCNWNGKVNCLWARKKYFLLNWIFTNERASNMARCSFPSKFYTINRTFLFLRTIINNNVAECSSLSPLKWESVSFFVVFLENFTQQFLRSNDMQLLIQMVIIVC